MNVLRSISRRSVLRGAVLVSAAVINGTGVIGARGPAHAAAGSARVVNVQDVTVSTAKFFDESWAHEGIASFPVRVPLLERTEGLRVVARWDPRLFSFHAPIYATSDTAKEIEPSTVEQGRVEFPVTADITEIALQVELLSTYPHENLAGVAPTSLTFLDAEGMVVDELLLDPSAVECAPWGVEALVDWVCHDAVIVPASITLISIGPNPAPPGLDFSATYADGIGSPVLTPVDGQPPATFTLDASRGFAELVVRTSQQLKRDDRVELLFTVDASDSKPRPFGEMVPRVQLTIPEKPLGMRDSGRLSSFPVTTSGSQESTYLLTPTA